MRSEIEPLQRWDPASFGPVEVIVDGRRIALTAAKPRALLAMLLVGANESVPNDRLIEELWAGRPPVTAPNVLQTYVSHLHKALGEDRILTSGGGYQIRLDSNELGPGLGDASSLFGFLRVAGRGRASGARRYRSPRQDRERKHHEDESDVGEPEELADLY